MKLDEDEICARASAVAITEMRKLGPVTARERDIFMSAFLAGVAQGAALALDPPLREGL